MKEYYVYIMASINKTIYIGVTNNLERRVHEHKAGTNDSFTKKYQINKLVYVCPIPSINDAITLEKKLKGMKRGKKIMLIEENNPYWNDLSF